VDSERCGKPANVLSPRTDAVGGWRMNSSGVMYARAVEDAADRLRELRREGWEDLGLSALVLALAVTAAAFHSSLALPLFAGGLAVGALGVRAVWRRWDLVERLSGEHDAYLIPEVLAHASREAEIERRHLLAAHIRDEVTQPQPGCEARVSAVAEELEALAADLDDGELDLDPACAVACVRLLSDLPQSPLRNPALPADALRPCVCQIRSGFRSNRRAA
jgi:hypothetical protein